MSFKWVAGALWQMVRAKEVKADDTVMLKFKPAVGPLSASDAPSPMLGPGLFLMEGRSVAPEGKLRTCRLSGGGQK